ERSEIAVMARECGPPSWGLPIASRFASTSHHLHSRRRTITWVAPQSRAMTARRLAEPVRYPPAKSLRPILAGVDFVRRSRCRSRILSNTCPCTDRLPHLLRVWKGTTDHQLTTTRAHTGRGCRLTCIRAARTEKTLP